MSEQSNEPGVDTDMGDLVFPTDIPEGDPAETYETDETDDDNVEDED